MKWELIEKNLGHKSLTLWELTRSNRHAGREHVTSALCRCPLHWQPRAQNAIHIHGRVNAEEWRLSHDLTSRDRSSAGRYKNSTYIKFYWCTVTILRYKSLSVQSAAWLESRPYLYNKVIMSGDRYARCGQLAADTINLFTNAESVCTGPESWNSKCS